MVLLLTPLVRAATTQSAEVHDIQRRTVEIGTQQRRWALVLGFAVR